MRKVYDNFNMAQIKGSLIQWITIFALTLPACSSEDPKPEPERYRLKEVTYESGNITQYEYDAKGRVSKIIWIGASAATEEYTYDSQDRIIKSTMTAPTYEYYIHQYSYGSDGNVEESIITSLRKGDAAQEKRKYEYDYVNKHLTQIRLYTWISSTNSWSTTPIVQTGTYDEKGRVTKITGEKDYYSFSYDEVGNKTDYRRYIQKMGSSTSYYLATQSIATFDQKPNAFKSVQLPVPSLFISNPNNVIDETTKTFNEDGSTKGISTYSAVYEYNSAGYVTKINNTILIQEKF
jgi:YD repeat-containing protein